MSLYEWSMVSSCKNRGCKNEGAKLIQRLPGMIANSLCCISVYHVFIL